MGVQQRAVTRQFIVKAKTLSVRTDLLNTGKTFIEFQLPGSGI